MQSNPTDPDLAPAASSIDRKAQAEAFQRSTNAFLATLHAIDARLNRQLFALEEADIISLTKPKGASLEPNGVGMIGGLDVGWLNSRSNKVEREMEAELWTKARKHFEMLGTTNRNNDSGAAATAGAEDVIMEDL